MKWTLLKGIFFGGAAVLSTAGIAHAQQSAEESVAVGLDIQITPESLSISGLESVVLSSDGTDLNTSDVQTFCAFTPGRYINMVVSGSESDPSESASNFFARNSAQTGADEYLGYNVFIKDVFSGSDAGIGSSAVFGNFKNGQPETNIDTNPFNTDANCSDGENLSLRIQFDWLGTENEPTRAQLSDGELHSFSDTLTIRIEPFL